MGGKYQSCKVSIDGCKIRYLDIHNPENSLHNSNTLLMLHGIGASAERWNNVIAPLSKYYRLIIPDIIGFGLSDKPRLNYTNEFFVNFLKKFLDTLNLGKICIMGSSFGGHVAIEYAINFISSIKKLLLVSPAGIMRSLTPVLTRYINAALYPTYQNVSNSFREMTYNPENVSEDTIKSFIHRMNMPDSKYAFLSTLNGIRNSKSLKGRLSNITVPTLIIWGENDQVIPIRYLRYFREIPKVQYVTIDRCGHTPYVEKPITFSKIVLKFLLNHK